MKRRWSRLTKKQAVPPGEVILPWCRPSVAQLKMYCSPQSGELQALHVLRPRPSSTQKKSALEKTSAKGRSNSTGGIAKGNRIVHLGTLLKMMNSVYSEHAKFSAAADDRRCCCAGPLQRCDEVRQACASTLFLSCEKCGFKSVGYPISKDDVRNCAKGRPPCTLNKQLALATIYTGISARDMQLICTFLDLPSPSSQTLSSLCKQASQAYVTCNGVEMHTKRQSLKERYLRCDLPEDFPIPVESDCRYNIRSGSGAGRSPGQPASQIVGVAAENLTPAKKIIALSQRTKAWRHNKQNPLPGKSSGLVPQHVPIGNLERAIGTDLAREISSDSLRVQCVTTDNDSKLFAGFVEGLDQKFEPEKQDCKVHRFRSIYRKVKGCKFQVLYEGERAARQRSKATTALARESRIRLAGEFAACSEKHNGESNQISAAMQKLVGVCLSCFHGDHEYCRSGSLQCKGRKRPYKLQYLDRKKSLQMTEADRQLWQNAVAPFFSVQSVSRMRKGFTTNKSESMNLTFNKTLPKGRTFRSTLAGRASSAVLHRNEGVGNAVTSALQFWNASLDRGSPACQRLNDLQQREDNQKTVRASKNYKERKKICRSSRFRDHSQGAVDATYVKDAADCVNN